MTSQDEDLSQLLGLLARLHVVHSAGEEQDIIDALGHVQKPTTVAFLNQHALNTALRLPSFLQNLFQFDYVFRDGVGVEVAMAVTGHPPGLNINGTDFIPKVVAAHGKKTVAVIGTAEPWLSAAVQRMQSDGVNVTGWIDGFRRMEEYLDFAQQLQPSLILLAMGMPQQEELAARLASDLSHPCLIINGGAIIDFYGGRFPRAPLWMRNARLEWLYRLFKEPQRLSARYLSGGVTFLWKLFRMWRLSMDRQR